jgi:CHASE3 domain sensor protein
MNMFIKWFRNLRLRSKIILLVAILVVFTGVVGGYAIVNVNLITENTRILGENSLPKTNLLGELTENLGELRLAVTRHMLANTEAELREHETSIEQARQEIDESLEALDLLLITESGQNPFKNRGIT